MKNCFTFLLTICLGFETVVSENVTSRYVLVDLGERKDESKIASIIRTSITLFKHLMNVKILINVFLFQHPVEGKMMITHLGTLSVMDPCLVARPVSLVNVVFGDNRKITLNGH